jgi:hypothetical protein
MAKNQQFHLPLPLHLLVKLLRLQKLLLLQKLLRLQQLLLLRARPQTVLVFGNGWVSVDAKAENSANAESNGPRAKVVGNPHL